MQNVTGITVGFRCLAPDLFDNVEPHDHVWMVTAFAPIEPIIDGRILQRGLQVALEDLPKGGVLPDELSTGEAIAKAVIDRLDGCIAVRVIQERGGFEAWVWR